MRYTKSRSDIRQNGSFLLSAGENIHRAVALYHFERQARCGVDVECYIRIHTGENVDAAECFGFDMPQHIIRLTEQRNPCLGFEHRCVGQLHYGVSVFQRGALSVKDEADAGGAAVAEHDRVLFSKRDACGKFRAVRDFHIKDSAVFLVGEKLAHAGNGGAGEKQKAEYGEKQKGEKFFHM